jgi:V-type H+-transporting ATPase subunit E
MAEMIQEFNIEKLQLVEAEKKKIKQEYERKEKQVDVRKKIEYSTQLNASRLKVLQAQDDLVRKMKDAAEKQLQSVSLDDDDYPSLLEALILQVCCSTTLSKSPNTQHLEFHFEKTQVHTIMATLACILVQGLLRLSESAVQLRCREQDLDYVKSVVNSAANSYAKKTGVDPPEVFVDEKHFLPGPPKEGNHGSTCTGGVVLATKDGRIVLENTLDARLEVVFKQQLPEIRKRLFPAGGLVAA